MTTLQFRAAVDGGLSAEPGILLLVSGALDGPGLRRLRTVVDTLAATPSPVTIDVSSALSPGLGLARVLCDFCSRRRALALPGRVRGLHAANVPAPENLALDELFVLYEQVRDAG